MRLLQLPHKVGVIAARPFVTCTESIVRETDAFIFDCDGVLWRGNSVIPGACNVIAKLKQLNKAVFFFTNNSTKSRSQYVSKFQRLGFKDVLLEDIFSSSSAASLYLSWLKLADRGKTVYAIGSSGLYDELAEAHVPHIRSTIHDSCTVDTPPRCITVDPNVEAVVVGFDLFLNYHKIQYAQLCLNNMKNCQLVATNMDATAFYTPTQLWAENGAMVGAITGCTGIQPIVVGKPSRFIVDHIVDKYNLEPRRMCVIGDRLDTDILLGKKNGMKTVLTLSGVTSAADVHDYRNMVVPDAVIESIANLV
ncbi:PGLP1B [Symbiodinium microadriaticum]|nr:PGLP1B [Symbiodinium microadriaticum]